MIAMIASRRTASALVRLSTTRAAPAVSAASHSFSGCTSFTALQTKTQSQTQQITLQQQPSTQQQRRTFFGKMMSMFSNDAPAHDDVTGEYLHDYFQQGGSASWEAPFVGEAIPEAMYALYTADAVCFDVDSTVISEEGIDVLAAFLGKGDQVAALTRAAMEGGMKFEDALKARLELMEPSKRQILDCLENHPLELTPGIKELVQTLQAKNVDVFLVSGGFRIMIEPLADILKIPAKTHIFANSILFKDDEDGTYAGFDATEPTSQDMGKPKAVEQLMEEHDTYTNVVMVGDGATDAQAKPPASAFIGFGGVVERAAVKAKADWFVTDFEDMTKIIEMRK